MLGALAETWGAQSLRGDIVADDFHAIRDATEAALESADIVVINAGSSAGREDFSARVIAVSTKPGATQLTVTPRAAISRARDFDMPTTPALAAA